MSSAELDATDLLAAVRACTLCAPHLPEPPRPVLQFDPRARVLVVGQAPGRRAHERGLPFDDASGDRLRDWLGVDRDTFYDATRIALVPMGFCWPGTGAGGDLPPRPECATTWRARLLAHLGNVELTVLLGRYALAWHLGAHGGRSVDGYVSHWREHAPAVFPLPHPSPRNRRWVNGRPWIEDELLPALRAAVQRALRHDAVRVG